MCRRMRKSIEEVSREVLARAPELQPQDAVARSISLSQPGIRSLDANTVLVPAIEADPGDVCVLVVVAVH